MDSFGPIIPHFVAECVRHFGWNVLDESAPQRNIQELWTTADCEQGQSPLPGCFDQRDLRPVSLDIGWTAFGASGLSIK